jgi:hypothetical protein
MQPRQQPSRPTPGQTNVDRAFGGRVPQTPQQPTQAPSPAPRANDTRALFRAAQSKMSSTRADGTSKWVSAAMKQQWLDALVPLYLHKLIYQADGKYGSKWILHLSEDAPENPIYFASFKANDYRDVFFPELQAAIDSSGEALGPLMLTVHQVEGQVNPSWDLQPWDAGAEVGF